MVLTACSEARGAMKKKRAQRNAFFRIVIVSARGIRAVKGVPFRGRRTGNWLTKEDAQKWLNAPDVKTLKGVRDRDKPIEAAELGRLFGKL